GERRADGLGHARTGARRDLGHPGPGGAEAAVASREPRNRAARRPTRLRAGRQGRARPAANCRRETSTVMSPIFRRGRPRPVRGRESDPGTDGLWPTSSQVLLLRAALGRGPEALEAWSEWKSRHDLIETELDHGSFRLLPLVYKNLAAQETSEPQMPR